MLKTYLDKLKTDPVWRSNAIKLLFALPIIITLGLFFSDDSDEYAQMGNANYAANPTAPHCAADSLDGDAGATNGEESPDGIKYNVRTPLNYDPTIGHALLMVYAPASANRAKTEKLTGLTLAATSAGFIIAYADHPPLSPTTTVQLGSIPGLIAKKWCIDPQRVALTGHSDGGTSAMALAFMAGTRQIPKAIAPSAAGIDYQDLRDRKCPNPIPVMIMHSSKDHLFPKYGQQASGWWAACNKCDPIPEKIGNGCMAYTSCANGVKNWY
jgi:polyhydroxybutyrate depolymerase